MADHATFNPFVGGPRQEPVEEAGWRTMSERDRRAIEKQVDHLITIGECEGIETMLRGSEAVIELPLALDSYHAALIRLGEAYVKLMEMLPHEREGSARWITLDAALREVESHPGHDTYHGHDTPEKEHQ